MNMPTLDLAVLAASALPGSHACAYPVTMYHMLCLSHIWRRVSRYSCTSVPALSVHTWLAWHAPTVCMQASPPVH